MLLPVVAPAEPMRQTASHSVMILSHRTHVVPHEILWHQAAKGAQQGPPAVHDLSLEAYISAQSKTQGAVAAAKQTMDLVE